MNPGFARNLYRLILAAIIVVSLSVAPAFGGLVGAQESGVLPGEDLKTNPKDRNVGVSVRVPAPPEEPEENVAPEPPILDDPDNNELLNHGKVRFKWELQEHSVSYERLEFYLNGELLFDDIATEDEETDLYRLYVDGLEYILDLQEDEALADGIYTWKVRVIDSRDNGRNSTTWTFTIDTQAPPIVVTQVDQLTVAITSLDATTLPSSPLVVNTPTPHLIGTTEANIYVQLTLTFPDESTQVLETTSDEKGVFGFELPYITQGQVVKLTIIAIDAANNWSVLDGPEVVYQMPVVVLPVLPSFLFPDPPTITLPAWPPWQVLPPLKLPPLPEPVKGVVEPIVEPIIGPTGTLIDLTAAGIKQQAWLLYGLIIMGIWLYLLLLFWLTGAPWRYWWTFAAKWPRWWQRGWVQQPHQWRETQRGWPLPGLVFTLQQYESGSDTITKRVLVTDPDGGWSVAEDERFVHELMLQNHLWQYPAVSVSPTHQQALQAQEEYPLLHVLGESWWWRADAKPTATRPATTVSASKGTSALEQNISGEKAPVPAILALKPGQPVMIIAWVDAFATKDGKRRLHFAWLRWLPRTTLWFSWVVSLLLLLGTPSIWSVLWFLLVILIVWRDWQWYLPQRWLVYTD